MIELINIVCIILLILVTIQDFLYRGVSWIFYPILFILFAATSVYKNGWEIAAFYFTSNLLFLSMMLTSVFIFFYLRIKNVKEVVTTRFAAGDVLFYILLCATFSSFNFLAFYTSAILLSIIGYTIYKVINKNAKKEIPEAGIVALLLALFISYNLASGGVDVFDDSEIISLLTVL